MPLVRTSILQRAASNNLRLIKVAAQIQNYNPTFDFVGKHLGTSTTADAGQMTDFLQSLSQANPNTFNAKTVDEQIAKNFHDNRLTRSLVDGPTAADRRNNLYKNIYAGDSWRMKGINAANKLHPFFSNKVSDGFYDSVRNQTGLTRAGFNRAAFNPESRTSKFLTGDTWNKLTSLYDFQGFKSLGTVGKYLTSNKEDQAQIQKDILTGLSHKDMENERLNNNRAKRRQQNQARWENRGAQQTHPHSNWVSGKMNNLSSWMSGKMDNLLPS